VNNSVDINNVRKFWEENPLCASTIPYDLGTKNYFEYYDRMREVNESVEFSRQLHEYHMYTNGKVLDIGSGNGYVLSRYAREGCDVYGIDITRTAIDLCEKRFGFLELSGTFMVGNADKLPFASETFDCVCSMGVLHHTPDTEKAICEIHRVLKPGGRLIVMFYHRDSALYRINFQITGRIHGKTLQQQVNEYDGSGNPKGDVYSREELRTLLRDFSGHEIFAGLLEGWMVLPTFGQFIPDAFLRGFARRWGWFLYCKAIKL